MKRIILALAALYSAFSFGATLTPIQLLNPAGSTSGQAIVSTGASSAPAWGNVVATSLAAQAGNTVVANVTGSSASPTAFAMPSCSTSTSALQYTSGSGFTCFTGSAPLASPTFTGTVTIPSGTINSTSIGATTASTGKFTTLQATGAITPAYPAGVIGNTTGSNVTAGSIGEVICAQVTNGGTPTGCASNVSTPISLTSGTTVNVASITLTAGDWDVSAHLAYVIGGTTTISYVGGSISPTSATNDYTKGFLVSVPGGSVSAVAANSISPVRFNVSGTTTIYLVTVAVFGTSTLSVAGDITARRR